MSQTLVLVLTGSLAIMIAELVYQLLSRRRRIVPRVIAVAVAGLVVYSMQPRSVDSMAAVSETASVVFAYIAMVLGMAAEYFYVQADRAQRDGGKVEFNLMSFLLPIFASPIVFIPLLTLTSDIATGGGAFTRAKLMVYLVAFQNGFFWKSFFEQQRRDATKTIDRAPQPASV